ncbi:hypothetical protein M3223_12910 [Paenibacillus pasadenensis]|uniref:hypothetical protein n=1 Tax=Paenibacillus pasadenensis TaxID=217090 RepID=UPI00203A9DD0|nr:hypothetical protein [Paenibacillus pasadenensis]MCM3748256.1 hypothetical protein [Paenibacillus pasadenensis]
MSERIKRRKKSVKQRFSRQGWGKLLLVLLMAGALVPAVLGYLNHRELSKDTTETEIAVAVKTEENRNETNPERENAPKESPGDVGPTGTPSAAGSSNQEDKQNPPQPEKSKSEPTSSSKPNVAQGSNQVTETQKKGGGTKEADNTGGKQQSGGDREQALQYERRLETIRQQCVRDAAAVLEQGESKMNAARRGELAEDELRQAGAELSRQMEGAEAGCKSSFDGLIAEAEQAEIPESERAEWTQSYVQSRDLLRAKMSEQLQSLQSAAG